MAYTLLADAERFRSVNASEPYRDPLNVMPRQLSEFFSRYARVAAVFGDAVLDRDLVARSASNDRFIRIGTDVADCELAILPKQEAIYEVDDGPASEFRIYPSVYHLIISLDQDYNTSRHVSAQRKVAPPNDSIFQPSQSTQERPPFEDMEDGSCHSIRSANGG